MAKAQVAALLMVGLLLVVTTLIFEPAQRRRALAFYAAWFVPGLGHLVLGRWIKGLVFLGILGSLLVGGLAICGWRTVSFEDNPFYYVGQFGSLPTFLAGQWLGNPKAYPVESLPPSWIDPGMLYVCIAGLLNVVVMLGVFDVKLAAPAPAAPAAPAAPSPEVKA